MKTVSITTWTTVAAMLIGSSLCCRATGAGVHVAGQSARGDILREIDDPATGNRWLLEQNLEHPGGPGRLVMVSGSHVENAKADDGVSAARESTPAMPVIRAGDPVTLVAHTAVMDASLEAVALAPAAAGAILPVRLKIGGRVVQAVALGPRRAAWTPGGGEMR